MPGLARRAYAEANRPEVILRSDRRHLSRRGHVGPFSAALLALKVGVALAGCTSDEPTPTAIGSAKPATGEPMQLDVLVYNIEYSGNASTDTPSSGCSRATSSPFSTPTSTT
jgi:hypothetical protein